MPLKVDGAYNPQTAEQTNSIAEGDPTSTPMIVANDIMLLAIKSVPGRFRTLTSDLNRGPQSRKLHNLHSGSSVVMYPCVGIMVMVFRSR